MLTHRLSVCPCKLWSQRPNAFVQLLKLRFTQDGARWLVLQAVDQSSEQVDVFGFYRRKLVVGLRYIDAGRAGSLLLLLEVG